MKTWGASSAVGEPVSWRGGDQPAVHRAPKRSAFPRRSLCQTTQTFPALSAATEGLRSSPGSASTAWGTVQLTPS